MFMMGMLALVLVFGLVLTGCEEDKENTDPKTLVISGIPATVYEYASLGGHIGIFTAGTTPEEALLQTGVVAGASLQNDDVTHTDSAPYTLTIPLYLIDSEDRWTGNGTYDIYVRLYNGSVYHYYKASSVNFSSGTTTVSFSSATEITL
jgi:hypothetical protein